MSWPSSLDPFPSWNPSDPATSACLNTQRGSASAPRPHDRCASGLPRFNAQSASTPRRTFDCAVRNARLARRPEKT